MSLETTLQALLAPLVSGRAYTDTTPTNPGYPLIVYQAVGGRAMEFGEKTLPDRDHARVQVWVWAKSRADAALLARRARGAIIANPWPAETYGAATNQHNADLGLYGTRQDFGVWYTP